MKRRASTVLAICALVVLGGAAHVSAQEAATITEVGWWSQRPGAAPLPKGGFEIALLPNGPASSAALRIDVQALPTNALLNLTESDQVLGDLGQIQACPTKEQWTAANPGAWADVPAADCESGSVLLGRNATGIWSADVRPLLRFGTQSLVLVPVADVSEAQQSVTFQTVFSEARLVASAGGVTEQPEAPSADDRPAVDQPAVSQPELNPGPVDFIPALPSTADESPSALPEDGGSVQASDDADISETGDPKHWWRLAYGIPLSIAVGAGAALARALLRRRGLIEG